MQNKIISPNKADMLEHLQFLFGQHAEYVDGGIEIAYTPADSGAVNKAEWFAITDLEKAADFAEKINKQEGVNVYVGAAIRHLDALSVGRSNIKDFYASSVLWCDLDDPGAAFAAKDLYKNLPPSFVVVTGRSPDLRAQVWWKLMYHETNPDDLKDNLAHVCAALNGDRSVVDPARVMRLAGSVAWPKKEGRVPELTEIKKPENPTVMVMPERFKSYFPDVATPLLTQATSGGVDSKARNPFTGNLEIQKLLEATRQQGQWHVNMRDAVAAMIGQRWPDSAIRLAVAPYLRDNSLKIDMITPLINSGRSKFGKPNPEIKDDFDPVTGEIKPPEATFKAIDIADIDLDNIPPRAWLFGDIVARKYVTMIAASPGAGKSVFTMQAALCAVKGKSFGPYAPHEPSIRAWVYNNEEGEEELRRRVAAMLIHEGIDKADIKGRFFMNSGESHSICIARKNIDGGVIHTPDYEQLKAQILANKIDLLVVDPFAETHDLNENSNDEIKTVAGMYRRLAIECNCAVLLVHHTRKGSNSGDKSSEQNSNADSARGGGAQIGVVRRMFTLAKMDSATAASLNVGEEHRYWYVRFDDAKTNITAPTQSTQWFKFKSVALGNHTGLYTKGDSVGVLCHRTKEEIMEQEGDSLKDERFQLVQKIAFIMVHSGQFEMTIQELMKALKANNYTRYKERKLRDFIKDTLLYKLNNTPVICEGNTCFVKYIEGNGAPEPIKITLRMEEIID
jgi:hypothetical protein